MSKKLMSITSHTPDSGEIVTGLLRQNIAVHFQAKGPSMNPVIRSGDVVLVRPLAANEPKPGAICLYQAHGRLVLHRTIGRSKDADTFRFTGDAALHGEETVLRNDILGLAESLTRRGRERALDTALVRFAGRWRWIIRPLRRLLFGRFHRDHGILPES